MLLAPINAVFSSLAIIYTAVSHKPKESALSSFFNSYSIFAISSLMCLFSTFSVKLVPLVSFFEVPNDLLLDVPSDVLLPDVSL